MQFLDWLRPDKIVHFFLFGVLCFLLIKGFNKQRSVGFLSNNPKISAFIFSCVYGVVIELLQEYVFINRSGEVYDALADAVGALIGLWIFNYWMKRKAIKAKIF
jgi:VanZ family protein